MSGIWRMPVAGGAAEQVSNDGAQGRWAVGEKGLYYVNRAGGLYRTPEISRPSKLFHFTISGSGSDSGLNGPSAPGAPN